MASLHILQSRARKAKESTQELSLELIPLSTCRLMGLDKRALSGLGAPDPALNFSITMAKEAWIEIREQNSEAQRTSLERR